jgi:hypothetical protein
VKLTGSETLAHNLSYAIAKPPPLPPVQSEYWHWSQPDANSEEYGVSEFRFERNLGNGAGWMSGWAGGGMWVWMVIGLLVVQILKLSKKQ